jgi:DNA polymerase III subunit gamma/tau
VPAFFVVVSDFGNPEPAGNDAVASARPSLREPPMAKKPTDVTTSTAAAAPTKPYVVLARKYRPRTFDDLIGQDALVQTLRNAFLTGRIAQAYMLTGVRGTGKTTTARILARAFNYATDTVDKPTIDMPVLGRHCADIMDSRHPDVVEMDAASNTGVDDVREIIESARYKPLVARMKVFVVDEVHMLSKNAFNALLKTLEEPPEHVKFVFATTEIRKVPVTVLSRCQRFDLRRVEGAILSAHFKKIVTAEGAEAADDALTLIARAAEGSVRDGLSILDQAIAMSSGKVSAIDVRAMLGLADRGRIFDLLEHVLGGRAGDAIKALASLHHDGAEPAQVLADVGEAVHLVTRAKIAGAQAAGEDLSPEERGRAAGMAGKLSIGILSRAWQMLLKGLEETQKSGQPLAAAEMVLIRLAYTADLPSPDELIRALGDGGAMAGRAVAAPPPASAAPRGPLNAAPVARPVAAQAKSAPDTANAPPPPWEDAPAVAPAPVARSGAPMGTNEPPPVASLDDYGADASSAAPDAEYPDEELSEEEADIGPALHGAPAAPERVNSFADVLDLVGRKRDGLLKVHLEENVSLVKFDAALGSIDIHLLPKAPKELGNHLREKLNAWTGRRWMIALSPRPGDKPVGLLQRELAAAELESLQQHPAVSEVLKTFPGAKITSVKVTPRKKTDGQASG